MPKKKFYKNKKRTKPVRLWGYPKERDYLLENLAILISSGIGISEATTIVSSGLKSRRLKKALLRVTNELNNGSTLWKALTGSGLVEESYINLIKVGEESGRLVDNLKMIITQQQKSRTFKAKVRTAMAYPIIVLVLIMVVGLGSAWFILPKILQPFSEMNAQIPAVTKIIMNFGIFLQKYGIVFVPTLFMTIILSIYLFFVNKHLRFIGQALLMHTPGSKDIIKQSEIARFGFVFSGLLNSGMPVDEALNSLANTSVYRPYTKFYSYLSGMITEGYSFQKSFTKYRGSIKLIPNTIQQMIFIGERSGNLVGVLDKISEIYEEKLDITTDNISILVEPILLLVVGFGVLIIGLSVIMPIYSLIGSVGG